jgi:hypothetical protein
MAHLNRFIVGLSAVIIWIMSSSFIVNEKTDYESQLLFKINRSRDSNEICYAININQNGSVNTENPIRPFWIKKTENNKIEPLTWIQNHYAYGIKVLDSEVRQKNAWQFQFVSYAKRTFELRHLGNNRFKVFTILNNKEIEVTRIFVQIDGGSFWVPSVPYVKLIGFEPLTGKEITETIKP